MRTILLLLLICSVSFSVEAQTSRNSNESHLKSSTLSAPGIGQDEMIESLNVYPNPVVDVLKISFKSSYRGMAVVSLFNNIGKQSVSQEFGVEPGNNLFAIDVRGKAIEPGIYFVQCMVGKEVATRKLIIK